MTTNSFRDDYDTQAHSWSKRLVLWAGILLLANVLADVVIGSPMMVLPQLMEHFETDQAAWLNAGAMLAGAIWSPLLAQSSDTFGKRRVLLATLHIAGIGALVCLFAPTLWVFLVGRFCQGAAFAAIFLTVALTQQICKPPAAMALVGVLTSGSSIVGIVEPFLMTPIIDMFGFRSVFVAAAILAAVAALSVRAFIPESPIRTGGRVDVGGAVLLGVGLGATLAYISLGSDAGWMSGGMLALVAVGLATLAGWAFLAVRVEQPIVDIRALSRPILLALLALALAAGAFRSMLQLTAVTARVSPDLGLGYGLDAGNAIALLLGTANLGIVIGGVGAGWIAGRIGPAVPLLGGVALGAVATIAMSAGVSIFPLAVTCGAVLGVAAGAIGASGYNLAIGLEAPERQGTTAGLVSVVLALGSVVVNIAGGEVLKATRVADLEADGAPVSTLTGIYVYIALAGTLFILASIPAITLLGTDSRKTDVH
uniref:Major facilitator superfamily MFS_1 n=1 Tax=Mycolicibacterium brisbanense TaxID=146020 RepID=B8R4K3_9MYCO|nr:major facilitator superfamily MFS_1 [Mycolicibacterium brisbanense]